MAQLSFTVRVGADGVLHVPLGQAQANRDVRVTVEPAAPVPVSPDYLDFLKATAGAWQGDFERPPQGDYEERNSME